MAHGADISEHQGALAPEWFDGFDFVIIRAHSGFRPDLRFASNWRNAKGRTLRGVYGYLEPSRDAAWQAQELLDLCGDDPPELRYWCDAEQAGLTVDHVLAHLGHLDAAGVPAGFYSYVPFLRGPLGADQRLARWPLWIAGYGPNDGNVHPLNPAPPWPHAIHQYTSAGGLDLNTCDDAMLAELADRPKEPEMKSIIVRKPGTVQLWVYDPANGTKTAVRDKAALDGMVYLADKTGLDCGPNNTGYEADPAFIDGLTELGAPSAAAPVDIDALTNHVLATAGTRLARKDT